MFNERIQQIILGIHRKVFPFPRNWMYATGDEASILITQKLSSPAPCLIARFGSIEIEAMMAYLHRNTPMSPWERFYRYASWDIRYQGWKEPLVKKLLNNTGFFPDDRTCMDQFAELYLSLAPHIDILGSWVHAETMLHERMIHTKNIPLSRIEPYLSHPPWSQALQDRSVLVIHPFTETIKAQYKKRDKLFTNAKVLPSFELKTIKAVQSSGGNKVHFNNWFQALDSMKKTMEATDFDIAIIGAGAYGMPLAAHAKALGKKAIHLGGATQMLFGIYGQRWINDPLRKKFINKHWVRPLDVDKVPGAKTIENGCYW